MTKKATIDISPVGFAGVQRVRIACIDHPLHHLLLLIPRSAGPLKDIEFKGDPLLTFMRAGSKIGESMRDVPFPPIQVAGAFLDVNMQLLSAVHRGALDIMNINEALIRENDCETGVFEIRITLNRLLPVQR